MLLSKTAFRPSLLLATMGLSLGLLTGCDAELKVPVTLTELEAPEATLMAKLSVDVTLCQDHDTQMESNTLLEAKQKVGFLFPGAQYEKCAKEGFDERALFSVPITVGTGEDGKCGDESVCLKRIVADERVMLGVIPGKKFVQKYERLNRGSSAPMLEAKITLLLQNDTAKAISLDRASVFVVKGKKLEPSHLRPLDFAPKEGKALRLSDVMTASIMSGEGTLIAMVHESDAKK